MEYKIFGTYNLSIQAMLLCFIEKDELLIGQKGINSAPAIVFYSVRDYTIK